jgi:DNA invertase Pin-like site-specific DNA recombinase
MLIGYARVSTDDQNLELQRDALRAAGRDKIYEDRVREVIAALKVRTTKLKQRHLSTGQGNRVKE